MRNEAPETMTGHCLCGAVRLSVAHPVREASACHCAMCRRWSGAAIWGFEAPAEAVTVQGPVETYRSSSFAERAWCRRCGTHLWIRDDGEGFDLTPGLFDDAADFVLTREVYADRAFDCVSLAGGHARVKRADYERDHPFVEDKP
ncbi:GFA family protein [Pikeienuella piscinae]|uniref:GFA family protein n=1 Tax=Pikeienuella piscinae TaxID=2748098 RepID=A0A7L5BTS6_9RHOB|nr:GFA family protein [Pikeienuella piscinae]QIE55540.1 GFA family protein [Pikeienuella piscinae]